MKKRKTLYIGLGIIFVCLAVTGFGMFLNRSTSREATAEELALYGAYDPGLTAGEILAVCTYTEDAEIGRNTYKTYASSRLPEMLHGCSELQRIAEDAQGNLYIQYNDPENRNVTLAYSGDTLRELAVYDPAGDILFHRLEDSMVVWEKFSSGVQWGR